MIFFNVLAAQGTFIASPGIPTASASAMAICFCRSRLLGMKMYDVINSNTPWWNPVTVCIATNQTFQLYAKDLGWEIFFDDRWNLTIHLVWSNLQSKKCEMLLRNLFMFSPSETRNTFIRITGLSAMSSMFGKKRNAYIYMSIFYRERESFTKPLSHWTNLLLRLYLLEPNQLFNLKHRKAFTTPTWNASTLLESEHCRASASPWSLWSRLVRWAMPSQNMPLQSLKSMKGIQLKTKHQTSHNKSKQKTLFLHYCIVFATFLNSLKFMVNLLPNTSTVGVLNNQKGLRGTSDSWAMYQRHGPRSLPNSSDLKSPHAESSDNDAFDPMMHLSKRNVPKINRQKNWKTSNFGS